MTSAVSSPDQQLFDGEPMDTQQTMFAIHRALAMEGVANELVAAKLPQWGVAPVGVKVNGLVGQEDRDLLLKGVLAVGKVDGSNEINRTDTPHKKHAGVLPVGVFSGARYPDSIMHIADIATIASINADPLPEVLATSLELRDAGHLRYDGPAHVDQPNNLLADEHPQQPLGLNYHLALAGTAQVELGALDPDSARSALQTATDMYREIDAQATERKDSGDVRKAAELRGDADDRLSEIYRNTCLGWGVFFLEPGDLLIFQASSRPALGRWPTPHLFKTLQGLEGNPLARANAVLTPGFGPADLVRQQRGGALAELGKQVG